MGLVGHFVAGREHLGVVVGRQRRFVLFRDTV